MSTTTTAAPGRSSIVHGKKRVLASAFAGTTIEWYDFYLYGTAAALVFNVQFFPMATELGGIVASFATLAVGVIARPLGGIIAGHLGDRIGRKALLVASLLLMGVASTLIGLLPTYEVIGWWAVVGLVVLRILQGLSAGAEWGGSALLSVEHSPARHRGFFGSFTQIGSSAGMLLATGAFFIVQNVMSEEQFAAYGWRIPFLLSALLVAVGLWIRLGVADAPEFLEHRASGNVAKAPLRELLVHHRRPVLVTIGLRLAQNAVYYLVTVYMLTYLRDVRGDSAAGVTAVMIASAIGLFSTPFWAWLSDRVGRKVVSVTAYAAIGVFGWVLFAFLEAGPLALLPLVVILGINLVHDAVYGPQAAWFAEQFPVHVRYSGVSFGYQVGTVLGGGLMPLIAALLFAAGGDTPWLIAGYLSVLAVLSVVAALAAKDPARDRRGTELTDLHAGRTAAAPVLATPAAASATQPTPERTTV
ncbi:MFS transporter [Kocuria rosea]|uniref:MFS transporter n=1 Tax=Kocuria rosea TaxID=1275 RepID=UPI000D65B639|nr:MFS transporter [Kocuria rosea]MEB2528569.1 MFS transporter [Kocuria rosea]MEB2618131.1 MFS transporter [Kocuria rosea]PWF84749.1 MFS transporter [Kocuria rosea]QCY31643.1 MFS transporter [Kocuria rosea]TQN39049.1 sugar phosphate permease [Kocuria rosea]